MLKALFEGLTVLKMKVWPYLDELRHYHFSLFNPLFWVFLLVLLFILSRRWGLGNASSFCALVAAVLLGTTWLANRLGSSLASSNIFDFNVLRMISLFIIALIFIYYFFIKNI